jgi:CheY-like chemotaxis protein
MVKILVVDDEEVYCVNLRLLLERKGHQVEIANDGPTALKLAEAFTPDLLIVDWMLRSEMNGQEVAQLLHALLPNLNSMLISGFPAEELEDQIIQTPITAVLRKPFSMDELLAKVELIVNADT